jgi:hypothetical protein
MFEEGRLEEVRALAAKYADYPVKRWADLFREVRSPSLHDGAAC